MSLDTPLSLPDLQGLIAPRLPGWLAGASATQVAEVHALCERAHVSRENLQAQVEAAPHYDAFVRHLMTPLFATLGEPGLNPDHAVLYWVSPSEEEPPLTCTLLQAALRSFTADDTEPAAYGAGSGLYHRAPGKEPAADLQRPLAFTPWAFAQACRALDPGAQFSAELGRYLPATVAEPLSIDNVAGAFVEADRDALAAEACIAMLRGTLDTLGQGMLYSAGALIEAPTQAPAVAMPAQAKALKVSGFELDRVLVVIADENGPTGRPCVLYIPNDPHSPLTQFESFDAMAKEVERRVHHPAYLRFLSGYVGLGNEAAFVRAIEGVPSDDFDQWFRAVVNPIEAWTLAVRLIQQQPPFEPPKVWLALTQLNGTFAERYTRWRAQRLSDAAVLATPVERLDRLAIQARHAQWVAIGEQLGLFVASFIPGVGQVIGVYSMVQAMRTVFEASRAWAKGDERQARALLFSSLENTGYLLASPHPVADAPAQTLTDRLRMIVDAAGDCRLWVPDLHLLGSRETPPAAGELDAAGMLSDGQRRWIKLNDHYIEVEPGATAWQAQPVLPADYPGVAPRLLSNGHGGWRGEYENPGQWRGVELVRRGGTEAHGLDDTQVALAHDLAGYDDAALQARAWRNEPLPGRLRYHLRRRTIGLALSRAIAGLKENRRLPWLHPDLVRPLADVPGWPADLGLEVVNGDGEVLSLHPDAALTVRLSAQGLSDGTWPADVIAQMHANQLSTLIRLGESTEAFMQRLSEQWVAQLEHAQWQLIHRMSQGSIGDPAVATLVRQFKSLPEQVAAELAAACDSRQREMLEAGRVPLAIAEEAAQAQRELRISLCCEAVHDGYPTADAQRLISTLPTVLAPGEGQLSLAHWAEPGRRERLAALAMGQRGEVRKTLGMIADTRRFFRPPLRVHDGRVGYSLSGRGPGASTVTSTTDVLTTLLRQLYPDLSPRSLQAIRAEIGEGPAALQELGRRQRELNDLHVALMDWREQSPAGPNHDMRVREARDVAASLILRTWQRSYESPDARFMDGTVRHIFNLSHLRLEGPLPPLQCTFGQVLEVHLADMALERVDAQFLQLFPNAHVLDLSDNTLLELPQGPAWLSRLRQVELRNIGPHCAGQVMDWLRPCIGSLQSLALSHNPSLPGRRVLEAIGAFTWLTDLELDDNTLTLTPASQGAFNGLVNLQTLSLDGNPLFLPPRISNLIHLSWLSLADAQLEALPPGLEQLMGASNLRLTYVNLAGNRIAHLPSLTHTEFFRRTSQSPIVTAPGLEFILDANPLDEASVAQLDEAGIDYNPLTVMEIQHGMNDSDFEDRWLSGAAPTLQAQVHAARETPAARPFFDVLSRIVHTAPYVRATREDQRGEVLGRAWDLASLMLSPTEHALPGLTELRDRLYDMATEASATCGDGIVLTLDQFEAEVAVWRAIAGSMSTGEGAPLREAAIVARRSFRQALLDAQAQRLVRARSARLAGEVATDPATDLSDDLPNHQLAMGVDEVEVRLVLRQRLQTTLDLPPVSERLYDAIISEGTAGRIAERVRALDTLDGFSDWLVDHQNTWREALERRYADRLDSVREPYYQALEHVLALAAGELPDQPLSPGALDTLSAMAPDVAWQNPAGPVSAPVLNEHQAQVLCNRLRDQSNMAARQLLLQLTRDLIG
ncbi:MULTISPECIES: dermonecrotic toxin domain-containing protein [Pseudomonas]|uniref:RING-type E3 ubiquitin transferase n=1 Tax=Pseudomonas quercus TaxID=2722792 RepID=A0ABX0YIL9_9PSED|nr:MULTISPECIES: DUF6543 domain-containing protein [Pseudomonas]MBF7143874.1 hypothetical protein [Pseudomonas sp. LY10J]NJP02047.1 hypothetical protein [Pseudomonas quercus]